jgi:hypothetical protein
VLIQGRSDERVGALDAKDQGAGMDAVACSGGPAIGGDRSGEGPLVILVADPCQLRATAGAATAQLAAQVTVVGEDGRGGGARGHRAPSAAKGLGALIERAASMVVAEVLTQAAGRPCEAGRYLFRREGEYWTVCFEGAVVRLRDAKGLRHLARLLADPGREFHAVDLEAADGQPAPAGRLRSRAGGGQPELVARRDLGDAGALLDATARAAYRARLTELQEALEEAEQFNDPVRAARARHEREFLVQELGRAVGLGGRDRRAAAHAERARLNATRAIRAAVANLARANPPLGRHLAATIRTGRYCAYTPDPRAPIAWNPDPGHRPGLNIGAPALNAHPVDEGSARRRSRGARSGRPREAAAVLIRLWIQGSQPLAGAAATEGSEPLRFDGWLELLGVVAELVAAAPSSAEDADGLEDPTTEEEGTQVTRRPAAAQRLPGPGGAGDGGAAVVGGQTGDQTGQEPSSTAPPAATNVTVVDTGSM